MIYCGFEQQIMEIETRLCINNKTIVYGRSYAGDGNFDKNVVSCLFCYSYGINFTNGLERMELKLLQRIR